LHWVLFLPLLLMTCPKTNEVGQTGSCSEEARLHKGYEGSYQAKREEGRRAEGGSQQAVCTGLQMTKAGDHPAFFYEASASSGLLVHGLLLGTDVLVSQ